MLTLANHWPSLCLLESALIVIALIHLRNAKRIDGFTYTPDSWVTCHGEGFIVKVGQTT